MPVFGFGKDNEKDVPNVPCGVERTEMAEMIHHQTMVPNVPCGVERRITGITYAETHEVPNVPCGVERGFMRYLLNLAIVLRGS